MGNETNALKSAELSSFFARYVIAEDNSSNALLNDASIFLSSGIEIFMQEIDAIECSRDDGKKAVCERLWGAYHLLRMAKGTLDAARDKLHTDAI